VAYPGGSVSDDLFVDCDYVSVVPALNLNLSSDIFASAAGAASSSYSGYKANSDMTENTYTLRYTYTDGTDSAVIDPSGTQVKVTGASGKYLMVQNRTGVYALAITSADQTVSASDIQMGSQESNKLENFNDCKVWIESTDADRITTAKLATQDKANVTITNPTDSHITIATTVGNGTASQTDITGEMTAVTYTAADGYYFPDNYVTITELTNGSLDGVSVTRVDASTIKVSGAPTATTVNITLTAATLKTYTITSDVTTDKIDFGSKNAGYTSTPTEQTIIITNTGNQSVTLSKNALTNYTVSDFSAATLAPNATATFTVQPNVNLTAGTYNETITVSTENGTDTSIPVTFKVNGAFSVTINPSSATITNGDSQILTANPVGGSGSYTYKWYAGTETTAFATTNEVTVNPSVTTTYKVVVNDTIEDKDVTATITVNPRTYTITYNSNGGSGTMGDGTATENEAFTLPACGFSAPTDKQFKNWAIGSTTGTVVNANGTYTFTGATTVYAIWEDLPSVETPTANPVAGTYTANQSVTLLTTTTGADIYYTTNGDTPSKTNGTKYEGAISVTGAEGSEVITTIKAAAVKDGMQDSEVATFEYKITIPDSAVAPIISTHPADATVIEGNTATFTVAASGSPAPTYQWQINKGTTWENISDATSASYTTSATVKANDGYKYRCVVTNRKGSATSNEATLTVTDKPVTPTGPSIVGDDETTGWDAIKDKTTNATAGSTITVDMNGETKVPGAVIDSIKGKDVNVVFDLGNGIKWVVNGQSVTKDGIGEIDFGVTTGTTTIPVDVVNEVTGERYSIQISLAYNGEFGFTATLSINMDAKNAGYYANLYYYNKSTGKLEFMNAGKIDKNGNVELTFTHASDYTIVVSDKAMNETETPAETPTPETPSTTPTETDSPKTGDTSPILLWVLILLGSGIGVTAVASKKRKRETR
jgi:hypothetical protein